MESKEEMPILEIVKYGNPVLTRRAEDVKNIDQAIIELAHNMVLTMHAAPGIGLAAPQVNRSIRLITVDLSVGENAKDLIVLINPDIFSQEGERIEEEGCLSVPDIQEKVVRPARLLVRGVDLSGKERKIEAEGLMARVFCHEVDHINGRLFIDNLSSLKKRLIKKKLRKRMSKG
jgi:peptide deformylase